MCVILDSIRLLDRVILPYGVRFLGRPNLARSIMVEVFD